MLRRLHASQPPAFAFTPANQAWAEAQVKKYPEGRQASAIIPLLFRAQEQEGWLPKPAIEGVADMLGMPYIRALEVATFYFMFQLSPVGSVAHVQVCGTTPCMLRGSEDLIGFCKSRISEEPHHPSASGKLSWEEVECLGACANAPMAQIGKDYYEDLSIESLGRILDEIEAGATPRPGSQIGRFASEPEGGVTSLAQWVEGRQERNASVDLALTIGDGIKRIDGTEVPLVAPWIRTEQPEAVEAEADPEAATETPADGEQGEVPTGVEGDHSARPAGARQPLEGGATVVAPEPEGPGMEPVQGKGAPDGETPSAEGVVPEQPPATLTGPREGEAGDVGRVVGDEPGLVALLNDLGIWHADQIAGWRAGEVAWVNSRLGEHRGAIERDDWVGRAQAFARPS